MEGALLLDKPKGLTSTEALEKVKEKLGVKKAGHTGTLDPIATGLLIILLGRATRFSWLFQKLPKTYVFTVLFGLETDTYDLEGKVLKEYDGALSCEELSRILPRFRGEIVQTPPPFSAKRVKGKRAYELARRGEKVELKPVKVNIYRLELLECNPGKKEALLLAEVSSGAYIRSLAHDLGRVLGIGGVVKDLRRTRIDGIDVEEAVSLGEFLSSPSPWEFVLPVDRVMRFLPEVRLNTFQAGKILKGQSLLVDNYNYSGFVKIYENDKFIGVGLLEGGILKPKRLLV
ncbi:MAG: tRNA pseudouridine(55) synthase TruB [Aquificae bacterium]|nr:tRNA pseudouridine(55) synthase TruB [Aquificota bacterium]